MKPKKCPDFADDRVRHVFNQGEQKLRTLIKKAIATGTYIQARKLMQDFIRENASEVNTKLGKPSLTPLKMQL